MKLRTNRFRRLATVCLAPAVAAVLGLTATTSQAGGHHKRAVLVPVESARTVIVEEPEPTTRVIYREIIRTREAPAPVKEVVREASPASPQAREVSRDEADDDYDRPTRKVVVERYVYRDVEPTIVREVAPAAVRTVRVRTVRVVPVQTYVVREVQAAPTYVVVKPKHHLFGH